MKSSDLQARREGRKRTRFWRDFHLSPMALTLVTQPLHGDKTFVEDRVGSSTNTDTRLDNRSILRT